MNLLKQREDNFHIIAKPSGPLCNLDCHYCFYTEKEALFPGQPSYKMSDATLENFVRNYIKSQKAPEIPFVWQGGEPTLMGLDFYKKVIQFQKKYAGDKKISNSLQTNGTLLDDKWCEFLAANDFLVGLSIDGPPEIHDYYRVNRGGQPTSDQVIRGLSLLQKYNVSYNVLTCVTKESAPRALEIYRYFKEKGVQYLQFIPIVERLPDAKALKLGLRHATPPSLTQSEVQKAVSPWTIGSEQYGDFLIEVFDEWVRNDVGQVHVMNFEWALATWLGLPSPICLFSETCGNAGIIEHTGEVYSCDHFMYPEYKLGNISKESLKKMMSSSQQKEFGNVKRDTLPKQCQSCEVRFACHGECPKHRFLLSDDGEPGLNYLCAGYKKYFSHIHRYMKVIVQLLEHGLPASDIMQVIKGPLIVRN
ncbi:anaerobic sulfatase maturase [Bacillus sp. EB106-08-02-XG196]|uniref:anaerobic sulfatase maturase n=1 Tax=Bacillus sp. EB106-08-02-XG196 TaxID=2737049 RepID=UPI0015C48E52|nr:anaerobic sulfatase maturase [Bacillus sp. EB106-08-02-XG196]NWQ44016.1 anaerobic sulfatase maturase [Bacillus sp. EB106-08-02-XG196]